MKRTRPLRPARLTPRLETLTRQAISYARASCRAEDLWWEKVLGQHIGEMLAEHAEDELNSALDALYNSDIDAYNVLADEIEAHTECHIASGRVTQLIAMPLLAWSRFSIPAMTLPSDVLANLRTQMEAHVLASGVQLAIADYLFSPDQLPQGFCLTAELTSKLGDAAQYGHHLHIDTATLPESMPFLADSRYLLAAVVAEVGAPLFRWQEKDGNHETAHRAWKTQGGNVLQPLLTGCASELLLPQAFFAACRDTDRDARPYSLQACVDFLKTTLEVPAHELRAVIAPFYEDEIVEYRIGFTRSRQKEVLYGLVWALLDGEDERTDIPAHIEALLKQAGLTQIQKLDHRFPLEFCDDCGGPLYPNPDGEIVHAEMPEEEAGTPPRHLH